MLSSKMMVAGGAALTLAAGGVAMADASGGGGTQINTQAGPRAGHHGRGALGPFARRLTHGDLHLFVRGHDVEVRVDRGVLQAIGSDSVTLHELDGSDVTVPVDSSTRVIRMGRPAMLSALRTGDLAITIREAGKSARVLRSPGHPPRAGDRRAH